MKRCILYVGIATAIVATVLFSQAASAHVLIKSTNNESAAILHIMPDDDPIAGEKATLMFDTQGGLLQGGSEVALTVTSKDTRVADVVPTSTDGSLVSASYVFPVQGLYTITYTVKTGDVSTIFEQTQRVSRGVVGSTSTNESYIWAEALLFIVAIFVVILGILAWNYRKAIFKSSKL